jgi:DNA-binding NarL/FixJ family response regulator
MGLRAWLQQFNDLEAIAEAETSTEALAILAAPQKPQMQQSQIQHWQEEAVSEVRSQGAESRTESKIDLAILDLGLENSLELCQAIASQFPKLPVLALTLPQPSIIVTAALRAGINGYCLKGTPAAEMLNAIRTCANGGKYLEEIGLRDRQSETLASESQDEMVSVLAVMRRNMRISGLRQIDRALRGVQAHLSGSGTSVWDEIERTVLAGRQRELLATRWLVTHLLTSNPQKSSKTSPKTFLSSNNLGYTPRSSPESNHPATQPDAKSPTSEQQIVQARLWQVEIFNNTATKLQSGLYNLTDVPLEIDILKEERKRELLLIILRQLEDLLVELRLSEIEPQQLSEQRSRILRDLWQAATINFFGKYYNVNIGGDRPLPVIDILIGDIEIVQTEILNEIPQVSELLSYLLFRTGLIIDNVSYAAGTLEAALRAENLLDNLIIGLANAVMQPLLNHFADVEAIKQKFYDYRLIATREIERFRNNLSWKYRLKKYFQAPQAIFESRFDLFVLASPGLKQQAIYAPRRQELAQLGGIQLTVTLALELQDAIAPRLRSAVAFIGSGIVYVLTNVVGRGIGLIGRGILQGIGSAWQDSRSRKTSDRLK